MLVYEVESGRILARIPDGTPYENLYEVELDAIYVDPEPSNWKDYRVVGEQLIKLTAEEQLDINIHKRILTPEEKILLELIPSPIDLQKAERAIETLLLLQEVL